MKNLFLLDGTTGPVKADVVRYLCGRDPQEALLVRKVTTRTIQHYERSREWPLDLDAIVHAEFEARDFDYVYKYEGESYGLTHAQIADALDASDNVFIIIRNLTIIDKIRYEYSFVNVVTVFLYADRAGLQQRLHEAGLAESESGALIDRNNTVFEGYRTNPDAYDDFVITDCTLGTTTRHLDRLIDKYRDAPRLKRNLVFVIMSFDPGHPKLRDYYEAMQNAVKKISDGQWECKNIKDLPQIEDISKDVKNNIRACRLVIADVTQNRPNVFYELGYGHGVGKKCLITMVRGTTKQFYPLHYRILEYSDEGELQRELERELGLLIKARQI